LDDTGRGHQGRLHAGRRIVDGLLAWYEANKRDLPWRDTRDPYAIWVSEVMLQQTQVSTVIPYFGRWMKRFPTVEALASADEQDVLSAWQGLGYYRRCRMLLEGARRVAGGDFPKTQEGILALPGIGRYTAGAIASIAFDIPAPLVDGNVERVFARLESFGSPRPALTHAAWKWAAARVPAERPGEWNQALMELGATICRPTNPLCGSCPVSGECRALRDGRVGDLPLATPKRNTVILTYDLWIPLCNGLYGVRQIPEGEWWHGMWEFPRESETSRLDRIVGPGESVYQGSIKHSVTHHRITMKVFLAVRKVPASSLRWVTYKELEELPMPAPQRKALRLIQDLALF
jgi:A/G-specific adenine glycosylase